MKSSPFFRQFSKPTPSQPADSKQPLSSASRSLSLPSSQEEESPTPAVQMNPAHQPPARSATYNAGFNSFSTTNQAVNLPIAYTPIHNNSNTNPSPPKNNNNYAPITTTTTTNSISNNNNHEEIHSPDSPSKTKYKEKVRNSAANNLATKIVQKSTQRLRTPSSATADSMTIAQAQNMMGDATNTAHIVISKRDPTPPTPLPTPPPTVISVPSKHFSNNTLHPPTNTTTTTTTTTTATKPAKPHSNAAPRRSPRNEKKIPLTTQEKKEFEDILKLIETEGKSLPLIWAAKVSIVPHLEFLISIMNREGVTIDINHQDGHGKTALHYAAARGYKEICVILLKHHANVSLQDCEEYFTPLQYAARSKHTEIVELLLNYGADVSIKDARGLTVLHTTAGAGNQEMFALLAKHCPKPINDYRDKYGRTCLYSALKYKAKDMIYTLICKYNADPLIQDLASVNCIHSCAMDQRYLLGVMYNAYISKHPNCEQRFVDCVDARGRTPIMYALRRDSKSPIKVAEFLISLKATLNVQDSRTGETPLHMAAQTGPLQLVQLLLNNGASPNTRNNSGELPLDLAVHVDIINALRRVTVASPKRKRADSDSDGEYETQADPEPRKRNIEQLKHGFAGLKNPEKKLKENSAFLGGDDDSTILSPNTNTHDLKKAVHHVHISPSPSSSHPSSSHPSASHHSSSPSHSHSHPNTNNNNFNLHTNVNTNNNNFTTNNGNNNNNFNTNNNTKPVNNVFIQNTVNHTSIGTSINNNTTINTNTINNTTHNITFYSPTNAITANNNTISNNTTNNNTISNNTTNNITSNVTNNVTNNNTISNNTIANTTNSTHENPSTETYTNSAPLATQATPYPLDPQTPLAVTLGPLAQQFIILEADLMMGEILGTGSFGEVVKGKYRDNAVAIKCMHKNLQSMQHAVSLYVNEIELMCRVRHPNVVRIFGCTAPPLVYIVMDYYPSNLSQLIQKWSRIPTPVLLKIAKGIANGLFYLHNVAKIIHRDMKPSNVLLDDSNTPKIADFGVARDNAGTLTMTGIGTPTYMAPEMLKGRKYSDKVDVYSFGLILWQMFTGQKPFADLKMNDGAEISPVQIAVKVATHRIRPKIPVDCPPSLSELITQCWEYDQRKRLSSRELIEILEHV